jgi:thiol-disulfide isomerase/thioredoxin
MKPSNALILVLLPLLAAAGLLAAYGLSHQRQAPGNPPLAASGAGGGAALGEFIPADPPRPAPPASFADAAGTPVSLADFRGRPIIVNLWATWCEPCLKEMPSLDRLAGRLAGKDPAILLISEDRGGDHVVGPFFAKLGLAHLKTFLDPKSAVGQGFAVRGLPTTILIDKDGRELGRVEGAADWDGAKARAMLSQVLGAEAAAPGGKPG